MDMSEQPAAARTAAAEEPFRPEIFLYGVNTPVCACYLVNSRDFVLGRGDKCGGAIRFSDEISPEHARIVLKNGTYYVSDLGSLNKTFLNGQMLTPGEEYPLSVGDRVTLSIYHFMVDRISE